MHCAVLFVLLFVTSCRSRRSAVDGTGRTALSAKQIIRNYQAQEIDFETAQLRLRVQYQDADQSVSPSATLRLERDKNIWLSAKFMGISVAKLWITPNRVRFYEKIRGRYFDGDFTLLNDWLGVSFDFKMLQQLFLGQLLQTPEIGDYRLESDSLAYYFRPIVPNKLVKNEVKISATNNPIKLSRFSLNAQTFSLVLQEFIQSAQGKLTLRYPAYHEVEGQFIPEVLQLEVLGPKGHRSIQIDYKQVDINVKVTFPFAIPPGARQIQRE